MRILEIFKKYKKAFLAILLIIVLGVFVFAFIDLNITSGENVDVEVANRYTYNEVINADCIVVRNEQLLEYSGSKAHR